MSKDFARRFHGATWPCLLVVVVAIGCSGKKDAVRAGEPPRVTDGESEREARLMAEAEAARLREALDDVRSELDLARQGSSEASEQLTTELSQSRRRLESLQSDYSLMMAQLSDALDEIERLREGLPSVQSRAFAVSLIADARVRVDAVSARAEVDMRPSVDNAEQLLLEADLALQDGEYGRACYLAQKAREAIRKKMVPVGNVDSLPSPQDFEVVSTSNLRMGPGTDHQRIGSAKQGDRLTALARMGEWFRVQTSTGELAWIDGSLVRRY